IYTYTHTHTHIGRTRARKRCASQFYHLTHTHTHTHTYTLWHTDKHTYTLSHLHTLAHTHTHTHTPHIGACRPVPHQKAQQWYVAFQTPPTSIHMMGEYTCVSIPGTPDTPQDTPQKNVPCLSQCE